MSAMAAAGQLKTAPMRVPNLKMLVRLRMAFVDAQPSQFGLINQPVIEVTGLDEMYQASWK